MLIDTGFRGEPVKVLENNGIEYKETQLKMNKMQNIIVQNVIKNIILTKEEALKHAKESGHKFLPFVRNILNFN